MTQHTTRYLARYVVLPGGQVLEHGAVDVIEDRITQVTAKHNLDNTLQPNAEEATETIDLGNVALMPGLVNAHSHAFQRDLRGRTEWLDPAREDEDFWSWREAMYALALGYDAPAFEEVTRRCFLEMLHSGITCVGEFHYVHHQPSGTPYPDPNELARRVIRAAQDVGIRLTLLRVAYHRAGHNAPATAAQRRFISPDPGRFLSWHESLQGSLPRTPTVKLGLAPHSIRAVPRRWLEELGAYAAKHALPLHIHACEQRAEIEQSMAEYGKRPLELFEEVGLFEANTTLVHATHLSSQELEVLERHRERAQVCACPTTERNLGDGFLPATALLERGVAISLGSDSHAEIDLWQEMRLVEYHERLQRERRNVLASKQIIETWRALGSPPPRADRYEVAPLLWPMATRHGARSLGWGDELGELAPGKLADMITLDLDTPALWRLDRDSLLSHLTMSAHPGAIKDVFVGGQKII